MYCAPVVTKTPTEAEIEERLARQEALALERLRRSGELDVVHDPAQLAVGTLTAGAAAPSVDDRIQEVLSVESLSPARLAAALELDVESVTTALRRLVNAGRAHNVGSNDWPIYTWRVGAEASAAELEIEVWRLISERPMTVTDLQAATGAPLARVDAALAAIRRAPENRIRLRDMSADHSGAWFVLPLADA